MKRKISDIIVPDGRRSIDPEKVAGLAESIKIVGLLNPITIDKNDILVAGAHRLAAHELLGLDEIECIVQDFDEWKAELAEIDENLIRNELDAIGIGELAIRRDEILDAQGLRAKVGDNQHTKGGSAETASPQTTADIASEIGISKRVLQENKQLARDLTPAAKVAVRKVAATKQEALRLARYDQNEQEIIARKMLEGTAETVTEAIRETARDRVRANLEDIAMQQTKVAKGLYDVIVIDPPWDMKKVEWDATPEQVGFNYPTMTEAELADLQIPAATDCHLWMWTTQRFLPVALRLLEKWGFKYVCTFVWHKPDGFQPLDLPKYNCEFAIYAKKGVPQFVDTKAFFTCFEAARAKHSEKPEAFYDVVRRVTAGRRLDMFNRRKIEGFDTWGNEAK
jgi:N6-adenosine-specific RNA methylase IME4/ParB-like chromosome segregation protein Spo0J